MKHYIIDGNNLIGKDKFLNQIQKKNKQQSRERLALLISKYFSHKKVTVNLHFDGFENERIMVSYVKIKYSEKFSADEKIKQEIEKSKNPRNIILITSDNNLAEFGRVCSCQLIKSEEFIGLLNSSNSKNDEQIRIDSLKDSDEFKKLFGIK